VIHLPPQSLVRHRLMRRRRAPLQRRATRADRWCCSRRRRRPEESDVTRVRREKRSFVLQHQFKIPVWWRRTVLPSLPWVVCFLSGKAWKSLTSSTTKGLFGPPWSHDRKSVQKKERKTTDNPREGWEDGTPRTHEASS